MNHEQSDNVSKDTEAGQLRQAVVSGRLITVCDKCLRAACWQGLFMCDEASGAGTTDKPIEELRKLSLESEGFWA